MEKQRGMAWQNRTESQRVKTAFGKILRRRRILAGYSQRPFSRAVGISNSHMRKIENGETSPTLITFIKICSVLGCSPSEFLTELDDKLKER